MDFDIELFQRLCVVVFCLLGLGVVGFLLLIYYGHKEQIERTPEQDMKDIEEFLTQNKDMEKEIISHGIYLLGSVDEIMQIVFEQHLRFLDNLRHEIKVKLKKEGKKLGKFKKF